MDKSKEEEEEEERLVVDVWIIPKSMRRRGPGC